MDSLPQILIIAFAAYLIGSVPWAYIIFRIKTGNDIRKSGSGNVGAMNAYETTGSKRTGIIVTLLDMIKGAAPVLLILNVWPDHPEWSAIAGLCAVAGHNWTIFLGFRGGRGLASALGVFLCLVPMMAPLWGIIWLGAGKIVTDNVHVKNTIATVLAPLILWLIPVSIFNTFTPDYGIDYSLLWAVNWLIAAVIIMKHIAPIRVLMNGEQ